MGGKLSVMGIYQTDMIFPVSNFPLTLPRFGILIKYYEMPGDFAEDILVRVFLPGDSKDHPTVMLPFGRAALIATTPQPLNELEEDQQRVFNLTYPIILSPLVIKQEGFVKVRVVCGARTTNLGSLMMRLARPEDNIPGFPPPPPMPSG